MSNTQTEAERLATFGARLNQVEVSVNTLGGKFDAFVSSFNERSRTPWGLIVSIVMAGVVVVTTIGGLVIGPQMANVSRLEMMIKDTQASSLSVATFLDFKASYNSNREISRNEYLDRFNNVKNDHDKDVASINKRVDELVAQLGGTYGLKDFIQRAERERDEMQRKLNELEARAARTGP